MKLVRSSRCSHKLIRVCFFKEKRTMPQAKVIMNVRQISPHTSIIDIQGEVTAFAEKIMMQAYTEAVSPTMRVLILNFTDMEYMNSSGIGLLVTLLIRVNRQNQRLFTYGLNEHYRHIFNLTRISDAIHIYESEAEALVAAN